MSDSAKAVFLSYASQDAEAARRICDALRGAGIEVWFDQSELVGGDAWDQKIRRQIKECALLIPIISAATQARTEGYFRLEWRLADQRTHLMSKGRPFLLPVVIDDTRDADAHVPDSFTDVQWTRLPGGETSPAFAARVKKLLIGEIVAGVADPGPPAPLRPATTSKRPRWLAPVIGGAVVALLALIISRPWEKARSPSDAPRPTEAVKPAAPLTEAQKLVAQARKIYEDGDELNRDNLYLAEELVQRATALDPVEPTAWELATWLSYTMVWHSIEDTQARREALLRQANRAVALAPDSVAAQLVFANAQLAGRFGGAGISQGRFGEIEGNLKRLAEREPQNWKIQRALGTVYRLTNRMEDAIHTLQRAIELSGEHPMATADLVNVLIRNDRYAEAEKILTRSLGHQRSGRLLTFNLIVKCRWRGDVVGAAKDIADWPEWLLQQDRGFAVAWQVALWARQPDQALQLVQQFPRQYVHDLTFSGPRAVLSARAQELAGNSVAAQADWRAVLQQCDQDLAANSSNVIALYWKAWALARLGDQAAAQAAAILLRQRLQTVPNNYIESYTAAALWATVGWADVAISALRGVLERPLDYFSLTRAYLEVEPAYDPIRQDPRFQALVEQAPAPKNTEDKGQTSAVSDSIDQKSVAVLPFANLSGDKDQEYFSDGLTEEILNTLARERDLRVPGRASSFWFKGKNASSAEIAKALNVARLVEGSVRKSGNKVRISVSLTRAADGFSEELGTFTEELSDIFALQDKVARAVVEKLTRRSVTSVAVGLTKNAEAYDAYLKGRALQTRAAAHAPEAIKFFEQTVALDPSFALAWARLAEARFRSFGAQSDRSPEVVQGTRAAIDRALALQPDLPEALIMRANWLRYVDFDFASAQRDLARAEAQQPATAGLRFAQGNLARDQGNWPEAVRLYREALQLDPQNGDYTNAYAVTICLPRGGYVEANELFRRAMAIQGQGVVTPFSNLIFLRILWRGPEAALRLLDRVPATQAGWGLVRADLLIRLGRLDEARAAIDELERTADASSAVASFTGSSRASPEMLRAIGREAPARRRAEEILADSRQQFARGNRGPQVRGFFIRAEIVLGHRESALAALQEWREEAQRMPSAFRRVAEFNGVATEFYARLGQTDEAVALLQEFWASGFRSGFELGSSPAYAAIRSDPRFQELVRQDEAWTKALPDPIDP